MTDKEKMKLIYENLYKQQPGNVITITRNELNFLVIQVEKLEKENKELKKLQQSETKLANEYFSKMDKYERALKRIISKNWVVDIHKIAENTLEETK